MSALPQTARRAAEPGRSRLGRLLAAAAVVVFLVLCGALTVSAARDEFAADAAVEATASALEVAGAAQILLTVQVSAADEVLIRTEDRVTDPRAHAALDEAVATARLQRTRSARPATDAMSLPVAVAARDAALALVADIRTASAHIAARAAEVEVSHAQWAHERAVEVDDETRAALEASLIEAEAVLAASDSTALDGSERDALRSALEAAAAHLDVATAEATDEVEAQIAARIDARSALVEATESLQKAQASYEESARREAAARGAQERQAAREPASRAPSGAGAGSSGSASSAPGVAWTTFVANSGGQAAIDACTGGLTRYTETEHTAYYPIHRHCGGEPILSLRTGDLVRIDGLGTFRVVDSRVVQEGDYFSAIEGLGGSVFLQTCYPSSRDMRVVGLVPA